MTQQEKNKSVESGDQPVENTLLSKTDPTYRAPAPKRTPWGEMQEHRKFTLKRNITDAFNAIVRDAPVNKIPESVFVNEMLPFMFDEIPDFAKNDPTLQMTSAKWIAAAGGPHAEFDVVNDSTGEVLFRCPAYFTREIYDIEAAKKRGRLNSMLTHAKQVSHMSPIRAHHFTAEQFTGRGVSMNREELIKTVQVRWNEIFSRYNRPLLDFNKEGNHPILKEGVAGSTSPSGGKNDDPPLVYTNDGFDC